MSTIRSPTNTRYRQAISDEEHLRNIHAGDSFGKRTKVIHSPQAPNPLNSSGMASRSPNPSNTSGMAGSVGGTPGNLRSPGGFTQTPTNRRPPPPYIDPLAAETNKKITESVDLLTELLARMNDKLDANVTVTEDKFAAFEDDLKACIQNSKDIILLQQQENRETIARSIKLTQDESLKASEAQGTRMRDSLEGMVDKYIGVKAKSDDRMLNKPKKVDKVPFNKLDVEEYFRLVWNNFDQAKVTEQEEKYRYLTVWLSGQVGNLSLEVDRQERNRADVLRRRVTEAFILPVEVRMDKFRKIELITGEDPLEMLRRLQKCVVRGDEGTEMFKDQFLKALGSEIRSYLSCHRNKTIEELATLARDYINAKPAASVSYLAPLSTEQEVSAVSSAAYPNSRYSNFQPRGSSYGENRQQIQGKSGNRGQFFNRGKGFGFGRDGNKLPRRLGEKGRALAKERAKVLGFCQYHFMWGNSARNCEPACKFPRVYALTTDPEASPDDEFVAWIQEDSEQDSENSNTESH
jgi:hypothetical protein